MRCKWWEANPQSSHRKLYEEVKYMKRGLGWEGTSCCIWAPRATFKVDWCLVKVQQEWQSREIVQSLLANIRNLDFILPAAETCQKAISGRATWFIKQLQRSQLSEQLQKEDCETQRRTYWLRVSESPDFTCLKWSKRDECSLGRAGPGLHD